MSEYRNSYLFLKNKIENRKDLKKYCIKILALSDNLLKEKDYEYHSKLLSFVRYKTEYKNSNYNNYYSIVEILNKEYLCTEDIYNKYKENLNVYNIKNQEYYYYLKENEESLIKYINLIKIKNRMKYSTNYFIEKHKNYKEKNKIRELFKKTMIENNKKSKKILIKSL